MLPLFHGQDEVGEAAMAVCILDNRGVGRSSSPAGWKNYTTQIMARDTLALMVGRPYRPSTMVSPTPKIEGSPSALLAMQAPVLGLLLNNCSNNACGDCLACHQCI